MYFLTSQSFYSCPWTRQGSKYTLKWWFLYHIIFKNNYLLLPPPLLVFWDTPIHHTIGMPGDGKKFFHNLCLLGLALLIAIVPPKKFIFIIIIIPIITITITIIIAPHPHPLSCNKPIRNKLQGRRVFFYCFITHFFGLEVIRDKLQKKKDLFQQL